MAATTTLTRDQVLETLSSIVEPEVLRPLTDLKMILAIEIEDATVKVTAELLYPNAPYKDRLEDQIRESIAALPGVAKVEVTWHTRVRASGRGKADAEPIKGVKNTIAIASGKGGVGKSTVAANLAVALARSGAAVGLLDTDVYGPSLPLMMGETAKPAVTQVPTPAGPKNMIVPLEAHGVKVMSIGFLLDPNKALIWRGPLVSQLINQFLNDVLWGDLDYLVMDLPPGTGDVQLTLTQKIPISGGVIVTTPQDVALADALKGLRMFEDVKTPVIGIIENMSGFICPCCGERTDIFGEGGGKRLAAAQGVELLGQVPIEPAVREGGDTGVPVVVSHPTSETAKAFTHLAERVAAKLAKDAVERPRKPMIKLMQAR